MKNNMKLAAVSALALALAGTTAMAQTATGTIGIESLDDQIDDVQRDAQRDLGRAEDRARYGFGGTQGIDAAVALTFSGTSGNSDTQDLSIVSRVGINQGPWNHSLGFGLEYGEFNDDDGVTETTKERAFAVFDSAYSFTEQFYVFGMGRWERNNFADTRDAFVGVGPGFRVFNTPDLAWRVQAGIGWRDNRTGDVRTDEEAVVLSSRAFFRVNDQVFITNDTDVLHSDVNTLTTNELGVNVSMTNTLSTRFSLKTDYNDSPAPGNRNTDNALGVSLVYSFN